MFKKLKQEFYSEIKDKKQNFTDHSLQWQLRFLTFRLYSEKPWRFLADNCGFMKERENMQWPLPPSCSLLVKTVNRAAGIITQPVSQNFYLRQMEIWIHLLGKNMLSDSRPLPLSPLIYSCGLWAAVWNCGPVDEEERRGSWNIHPDNKQSLDGPDEEDKENIGMKRKQIQFFQEVWKKKTTQYKFPSQ